MIEKYFALKYFMTIASTAATVVYIVLFVAANIVEEIQFRRRIRKRKKSNKP